MKINLLFLGIPSALVCYRNGSTYVFIDRLLCAYYILRCKIGKFAQIQKVDAVIVLRQNFRRVSRDVNLMLTMND